MKQSTRRLLGHGRAPAVIAAATILAITVGGAVAIAQEAGTAGGDGEPLRLGRTNGSGANPVAGQTVLFASNNEYALRESNLSDSGGGAIHGCRTQPPPANAGAPGDKPCLRANNLSTGQAFQFNSTNGNVGGRIQVGGANNIGNVNPTGVPFETNAQGRVVNLNSDMVDGQHGPFLPQDGKAQSAITSDTATTANTANTANSANRLNGVVRVQAASASNSSTTKVQSVSCPAGTRVLGAGASINGGKNATGTFVSYDDINILGNRTAVRAAALEIAPGTALNWQLVAEAVCGPS